jgi:hypothetical protein
MGKLLIDPEIEVIETHFFFAEVQKKDVQKKLTHF